MISNDRLLQMRTEVEMKGITSVEDLLSLIDSTLHPPGEIGEIVDGLRQVRESGDMMSWNVEIRPILDSAIAYLSHPGEQQQLVKARQLLEKFNHILMRLSRDTRFPESTEYVSLGFQVSRWLEGPVHKANADPTDAALREAAKAPTSTKER